MKFTSLVCLALVGAPLAFSSAAFAAKPRDVTDGNSENLAVQKVICQQLYMHTPNNDVTFKPGVDVNGRNVPPPDLPGGSPIGINEFLEVPLTVDLAQRLSQPVPAGVEMKAIIGNLRLYKDGRITNNGADVIPQASTMCGVPLQVVPEKKVQRNFEEDTVVKKESPAPGSTALSVTENPIPKPKGPPKLAKKSANFLGRPAN